MKSFPSIENYSNVSLDLKWESPFWYQQACFFLVILWVWLVLSGCSAQESQNETQVPMATLTPEATPTSYSTMTAPTTVLERTSQAAIPISEPAIRELQPAGDPYFVGMGGYTFKALSGFQVEVNVTQATISDLNGHTLFSMVGATPQQVLPPETLLKNFLANMAADDNSFQASGAYVLTVSRIDGLAADIGGTMFNRPFRGRVAFVLPSEGRMFSIMAIGFTEASDELWSEDAEELFNTVLSTLEFIPPTDSACPVSDDPTYGYNPDHPILIREIGDEDQNPIEGYLNNLGGPNFDPVTFESLDPVKQNGVELRRYTVEYPGITAPVTLYFDTQPADGLQAPLGFKCPEAFNLAGP